MKTKFLLIGLLSLVMTLPVIAQTDTIPNFGFENWSTYNGFIEVPDNWFVETITTSITDSSGTYIVDVISSAAQTTDSYAGNYAVALSNKLSFIYYGDTCSLFGKMFTLPPDSSVQNLKPAFPVSARHTSLNGYYKFTPENGDSCQFIVAVYKYGYVNPVNPLYGNIVGLGFLCKSTSYFDSSAIPDSASIALSAYKQIDFTIMNSCSPLGNSVLYVDNLCFDTLIASMSEQTAKNTLFSLYPNPASDIVTLNIDNTNNADLTLNIYNVIGTLVKSEMLKQNQRQINIGDLSNGVYMVTIKSKDLTGNQRLIIQR
jgi:hypothetical protein